MPYMKQMLQEQSMFFSELNEDVILSEAGSLKKILLLLTQVGYQDTRAKELKKLVVETEKMLDDKNVTREKNSKLASNIYLILRIFTDANYLITGAKIYRGVKVSGTLASMLGLGNVLPALLPFILTSIVIVACNRLLRYLVNDLEYKRSKKDLLKILSELKKLEKKAPPKEKAKIKAQIKKIEDTLKEHESKKNKKK